MNVAIYLKKRLKFFLISLIAIAIFLIITFISLRNVNYNVSMNTKNLSITFQNGKKGLQFGEKPMTFQQGISSSPANIYKIVNKSDFLTEYIVTVSILSKKIDTIDVNKVILSVNDEFTSSLAELKGGVLYTSQIEAHQEQILNIKIWPNADLIEESDKDKTLTLNINVKEKDH